MASSTELSSCSHCTVRLTAWLTSVGSAASGRPLPPRLCLHNGRHWPSLNTLVDGLASDAAQCHRSARPRCPVSAIGCTRPIPFGTADGDGCRVVLAKLGQSRGCESAAYSMTPEPTESTPPALRRWRPGRCSGQRRGAHRRALAARLPVRITLRRVSTELLCSESIGGVRTEHTQP